jgi:hypothetical protein
MISASANTCLFSIAAISPISSPGLTVQALRNGSGYYMSQEERYGFIRSMLMASLKLTVTISGLFPADNDSSLLPLGSSAGAVKPMASALR